MARQCENESDNRGNRQQQTRIRVFSRYVFNRKCTDVKLSQAYGNKKTFNNNNTKKTSYMKTTLIRKSANATMRFKMTFKVTLHVLLGIAVLFIAIIPARMVSGIFSQDTTIFIISLSGFIALLEYVVWCFLNGPSVVYDSLKFSKADGLLRDSPTVDVPIKPTLANTEMDSQGSIEKVVEEAEVNKTGNNHLALYKKGCDDYYQNVAAQKKEQLDIIAAYLHYIMAPFIKQEEMDSFCSEIMSFAINPDYLPKPWKGLKGTLTSFDVRHLIWNIAVRLGLGKGKPYSVETCINFIRTMFPDLCEDLDSSTLKNLRVTSTTEKIHIDEPGNDGLSFHVNKSLK